MSFPPLTDFILPSVLLIVGVPIAYLLSRALKLRPKPISISDPKREATHALWMIVPFVSVAAIWRTFLYFVYVPTFHLGYHFLNGGQIVDAYDLVAYLLLYVVEIPLLVIVLRRTGQKLGSIGITRANLGRVLALGLSSGAIYVLATGALSSFQFTGLSSSLFYGLVVFTMVGFVEEVIWRGYIQTRLVARGGNFKGLLFTSLMFALLWHFPVAYYTQASENVLGALLYASERFFPGFLFGYLMIRSQNVIPSSILHLFDDWIQFLWK
jgi:membrane protease YdiL (CAAX protease family)